MVLLDWLKNVISWKRNVIYCSRFKVVFIFLFLFFFSEHWIYVTIGKHVGMHQTTIKGGELRDSLHSELRLRITVLTMELSLLNPHPPCA